MNRAVTLVVHGTYAAQAKWWRLGTDGEATFADRLEDELSRRGLSGTVWKPALAEGLDYSSFAWSGRNRHRHRIRGASGLSSSLNELAQRVAATPSEPLTVNFVAHSHGGNVVLEALRHLRPNVRVGRIALLGTPLVTVSPAFRFGRTALSMFLLGMFFLMVASVVFELGSLFVNCLFSTCHFAEIEETGRRRSIGELLEGGFLFGILVPLAVLGYGWFVWLFGNLVDVTWRVLCRLAYPFHWFRGQASSLVYGPSPRKLATILGGAPILLLTSHNDEADLLLQLGSAPARLYQDYVATEFPPWGRFLELLLLRPFVLAALLQPAEMLLEVVSLGCSVWRAFLLDFEVAPLDERPYYPPHLLVRQTIDVRPTGGPATMSLGTKAVASGPLETVLGQRQRLRFSLQEVTREITRQIQLRHSAYYDNVAVIRVVAEFLTGGGVKTPEDTMPSPSPMPSREFWEALLVGNVALAGLFTWIAGPARPDLEVSYWLALGGYLLPSAVFGIVLALHWMVRRRRPLRLWRWFWVIWAVYGLLGLLGAVGHRTGAKWFERAARELLSGTHSQNGSATRA